jgi:uncharacterized protein YutE (UPF0331/DUF86 family)
MLDKQKIREKIKVIQRERSLLEDFVGIDFEEFSSPERIHEYYGAIHHLQVALQAVLDVSQHIVAQKLLGIYKANRDVFALLSRSGIIPSKLAENLEKAIGARNILVHQYEDVDPLQIYNIIQNNLSDFDKFVVEINTFLNSQ